MFDFGMKPQFLTYRVIVPNPVPWARWTPILGAQLTFTEAVQMCVDWTRPGLFNALAIVSESSLDVRFRAAPKRREWRNENPRRP